eukprot:gene4783-9516_t
MLVFFLWGTNYNVIKFCLKSMSPILFIACSFGSGALVATIGLYKYIKFKYLLPAVITGICICLAYTLQVFSLSQTLVGKTAFYATLDIPITALIECTFRKIEMHEYIGIICTLIGAFLLSWDGQSISPNHGDWLSIFACIPSSLYFIACSHYSNNESQASLCVGQLVITAIVCAIFSPILETPVIIWRWELGVGLLITGCLSCGIALFVLTWAQMYTTPTRTVIIGAPEPVFAALFAFILYNEHFSSYLNIIGCILMLLASDTDGYTNKTSSSNGSSSISLQGYKSSSWISLLPLNPMEIYSSKLSKQHQHQQRLGGIGIGGHKNKINKYSQIQQHKQQRQRVHGNGNDSIRNPPTLPNPTLADHRSIHNISSIITKNMSLYTNNGMSNEQEDIILDGGTGSNGRIWDEDVSCSVEVEATLCLF